jgi:hypothetical protein
MIGDAAKTAQIPARCSSLGSRLSVDSVYDAVEPQSHLLTLLSGCGEPWPKVTVVGPAVNEARNLPDLVGAPRPVFGLDVETDVLVGTGTRLWRDGFEVETLINVRIAQAGLKVMEVASHEHSWIEDGGNLNAASDGWRVLLTIFAERCCHHRRRAAQSKNPTEVLVPETGLCG